MPDQALSTPEQGSQATPQQGQQAPVTQPVIIAGPTPPPTQEPTPPSTAPTAEQFADLQRQVQQREQQFQQQQEQYRHLQGAYTQSRQQIAALAGTQVQQPQQDPLAPFVQELVAQGFDDKSSRAVAALAQKMTQQAMQPLQQQLQQSQAAIQGIPQVETAMNQLYGSNPALFPNSQAWEATKQALTAQVMAGGVVDLQQAEYTAVIAAHEAAKRSQQQPQQVVQFPQQQPIAQPFARGMFSVTPNFQQQPQPGPAALPADAQFVADEMRARFNLPKTA